MTSDPVEVVEAIAASATADTSHPFTIKQLLAMQIPEEEWVVEKLIPQGITLVTGASRSYKTFLMHSLAGSISSGTPFLQRFHCLKSNVLIIDEENHRGILQKRHMELGTPEDLPIHFFSMRGIRIDQPALMGQVLTYCKEHAIRVVIIDSLVRVHSANENSADEMSRALKGLNTLTVAGISVVLIHHHRKQQGYRSGSESVRGSSDIFAFSDCHIGIERDGRTITLAQGKLRIAEEMPAFRVRLNTDENGSLWFTYEGQQDPKEDVSGAVVEAIQRAATEGKACSREYISQSVLTSKSLLDKTLKQLEEQSVITKTAGSHNKFLFAMAPTKAAESAAEDLPKED